MIVEGHAMVFQPRQLFKVTCSVLKATNHGAHQGQPGPRPLRIYHGGVQNESKIVVTAGGGGGHPRRVGKGENRGPTKRVPDEGAPFPPELVSKTARGAGVSR